MPANEPDPVDFEAEIPPDARKRLIERLGYVAVPPNALKVFLGNCLAWNAKTGTHGVLRVGGEDIITLKCTPNGLFVCATIRRKDGRDVARITDNKFEINPNNYFQLKRPDRHEIQVFDKSGDMVLKARYINENAIVFQGVFFGKNGKRIVVTEDTISDGVRTMRKVMSGDSGRSAWSF